MVNARDTHGESLAVFARKRTLCTRTSRVTRSYARATLYRDVYAPRCLRTAPHGELASAIPPQEPPHELTATDSDIARCSAAPVRALAIPQDRRHALGSLARVPDVGGVQPDADQFQFRRAEFLLL